MSFVSVVSLKNTIRSPLMVINLISPKHFQQCNLGGSLGLGGLGKLSPGFDGGSVQWSSKGSKIAYITSDLSGMRQSVLPR